MPVCSTQNPTLDANPREKSNMEAMPDYSPRIIDETLEAHLKSFGAVSVEGPKWCGKTTTCLQHANTFVDVSDPAGDYALRELAKIDPYQLFKGTPPVLVDEWSLVPSIWDAARHEVDRSRKRGQLLLSASTTPRKTYHSGAGRIARLAMRTMTLAETGASSKQVSLKALLDGEKASGTCDASLDAILDAVCRGGWPETQDDPLDIALPLPEQYVSTLLDLRENDDPDAPKVDPVKMRALVRSLARNTAQTVSKAVICKDAGEDSLESESSPSYNTTLRYYDILKRLYIVEEQPAWDPALRSPVRVRSTPKMHLTDPSLAVAGLGASPERLARDPKTLGTLFETHCYRDLDVYARSFGASVLHYRDNSDLEVDVIIERKDGSWGAFEVKLGPAQIENAAKHLHALERKMVEGGQEPPVCKCVVVGTFSHAYTREDGVQVVPLLALAP